MLGFLLFLAVAGALVLLVLTVVVAHDATHPVRRTGAYAAARGLPFDPRDLGYEFTEWTLETQDAARLPVWDVELADKAAPRQITVVLIHGWNESRIDMLSLLQTCSRHTGRAVLYDLRGHGDATHASRLGNGEVDDLIALVQRLGGDDPLILIGRDLGANIALAAAARAGGHRDRIVGVVAISPYSDFHMRWRERLRTRDFPARPMTDLVLVWLRVLKRPPLVVDEQTTSQLMCPVLRLTDWDDREVARFLSARSGEPSGSQERASARNP